MLSPMVRRINNHSDTSEVSMISSVRGMPQERDLGVNTRTSPRKRKIKLVKNAFPEYKPPQTHINVGVYPPDVSTHFQADSQVSNLLLSKENLIRAPRPNKVQPVQEFIQLEQKVHAGKSISPYHQSFSNFLRQVYKKNHKQTESYTPARQVGNPRLTTV